MVSRIWGPSLLETEAGAGRSGVVFEEGVLVMRILVMRTLVMRILVMRILVMRILVMSIMVSREAGVDVMVQVLC